MHSDSQKIRFFRGQIPNFACRPGCHDCCGPVLTSSTEAARLPQKSAAEHAAAQADWRCVHLGPNGCQVYAERPLVCRLFGTTAQRPCPNHLGPAQPTAPHIEEQIQRFFRETRHVLV